MKALIDISRFHSSIHDNNITKDGKHKRLPMGVVCSPDIFETKVYDLLGDIARAKAYINDLLVVKM